MTLDQIRNTPPTTPDALWNWTYAFTGVKVARQRVCRGHTPPFAALCSQYFDRPKEGLWLGARGSGKSFLSALETHLTSRRYPRSGTRILGGALSQSAQIYEAIKALGLDGKGPLGSDRDTIRDLLKTEARYRNGSEVKMLACSQTSVRGPHIPSLKLDEVDEVDPELRESAYGMNMAKAGLSASVLMTSTWHRVGGPMSKLVDAANGGSFPLHTFCIFEVAERCPASRSGPWVGGEAGYAKCPECPIKRWCHAERDINGDKPLCKLSNGHYAIDAIVQKANLSIRAFEADYLCRGARPDGLWFPGFDRARHVSLDAEYDPTLPVHLSFDSGVHTGAVFFQVRHTGVGKAVISVFADYYSEGITAESNALAILEIARTHCNARLDRVTTDPAGGSRNAMGGPTVIGAYESAGLKNAADRRGSLERWPVKPGFVADALALVESFVSPASDATEFLVHPRCGDTIGAFESYRRAKRSGQWQDYPEDPQHPAEDLIDSLKGGLKSEFPEGRIPPPKKTYAIY